MNRVAVLVFCAILVSSHFCSTDTHGTAENHNNKETIGSPKSSSSNNKAVKDEAIDNQQSKSSSLERHMTAINLLIDSTATPASSSPSERQKQQKEAFNLLQINHEFGYSASSATLAVIHYYGLPPLKEADWPQCAKYLSSSCQQQRPGGGGGDCNYILGMFYAAGIGGYAASPALSMIHFEEAALENAHVGALMAMGWRYSKGAMGVAMNHSLAFQRYEQVAKYEMSLLLSLSPHIITPPPTKLNKTSAKQQFQQNRSFPSKIFFSAIYGAGGSAHESGAKGKGTEEAIEFYKYNHDQTDPSSQLFLANIYYEGIGGVRQDFVLARQHFERAADGGNSHALAMLGIMDYWGEGLELVAAPSPSPSISDAGLERESDESRNSLLQHQFNRAFNLPGTLYNHKNKDATIDDDNVSTSKIFKVGTPNYSRSLKSLQKATKKGSKLALLGMGLFYWRGHGLVTPDLASAISYLSEAAEAGGFAEANYWLATLLMQEEGEGEEKGGKVGGAANEGKILNYLLAAVRGGFRPAFYALARYYSEKAATQVSTTPIPAESDSGKDKLDLALYFMESFLLESTLDHSYFLNNNSPKQEEYIPILSHYAHQGHKIAQTNLALSLDTLKQHQLAMLWWDQLSSLHSDPEASLQVGDHFWYGLGVPASALTATAYYLKAVNLKGGQAAFNLGWIHHWGVPAPNGQKGAKAGMIIDPDPKMASTYYQLSMALSLGSHGWLASYPPFALLQAKEMVNLYIPWGWKGIMAFLVFCVFLGVLAGACWPVLVRIVKIEIERRAAVPVAGGGGDADRGNRNNPSNDTNDNNTNDNNVNLIHPPAEPQTQRETDETTPLITPSKSTAAIQVSESAQKKDNVPSTSRTYTQSKEDSISSTSTEDNQPAVIGELDGANSL